MHIKIKAYNIAQNKDCLLKYDYHFGGNCKLELNKIQLFDGNNKTLAEFIINSFGKTRTEWIHSLYKLNPELKNNFSFETTVNLMIFRSFCVFYQRLGLNYKSHEPSNDDIIKLYDDFFMDNTGKLGSQPSIYVVEKDISEHEEKDCSILYDNQLLFKMCIEISNSMPSLYFIPFNLPITDLNEVNNKPAIILWNKIKIQRKMKMKNFCNQWGR